MGFLELSQNFQDSGCTVRLLFEPTSYLASVVGDQVNDLLTAETLSRLRQAVGRSSEIDLQLYHQLSGDLALSPTEEQRLQPQSDDPSKSNSSRSRIPNLLRLTDYIGLDLRTDAPITLKYYRSLLGKAAATGTPASTLAFRALRRARPRGRREMALARVEDYLRDRTQGDAPAETHPRPFMLSCDMVEAARARFKVYILEPLVSMDRVADLWTLGGRLNDVPDVLRGLEILRELWAVLGITEGYHFAAVDAGGSTSERWTEGEGSWARSYDDQFFIVYFELHPDDPYPRPQVYFNLNTLSDSRVVDAVTAFF